MLQTLVKLNAFKTTRGVSCIDFDDVVTHQSRCPKKTETPRGTQHTTEHMFC